MWPLSVNEGKHVGLYALYSELRPSWMAIQPLTVEVSLGEREGGASIDRRPFIGSSFHLSSLRTVVFGCQLANWARSLWPKGSWQRGLGTRPWGAQRIWCRLVENKIEGGLRRTSYLSLVALTVNGSNPNVGTSLRASLVSKMNWTSPAKCPIIAYVQSGLLNRHTHKHLHRDRRLNGRHPSENQQSLWRGRSKARRCRHPVYEGVGQVG